MYRGDVENILQKYFKCKKPFLNNPYRNDDGYSVTMTKSGYDKYGELISLLYDVGKITGIDVNDIVEELDDIISEI